MLFLRFFSPKRTIWVIAFCLVFIGLNQRGANACTNIEQKRHILLEHKPEPVSSADFIGKVEIQKVRKKGVTVALLLESQTHPHQIGKRVTIAYDEGILCGNRLGIGNTGFIIGRFIEMASFSDRFLFVRPYTTSISQDKPKNTTKEEKILIYCFKGHRDNNYVRARGNNCSSNL